MLAWSAGMVCMHAAPADHVINDGDEMGCSIGKWPIPAFDIHLITMCLVLSALIGMHTID